MVKYPKRNTMLNGTNVALTLRDLPIGNLACRPSGFCLFHYPMSIGSWVTPVWTGAAWAVGSLRYADILIVLGCSNFLLLGKLSEPYRRLRG